MDVKLRRLPVGAAVLLAALHCVDVRIGHPITHLTGFLPAEFGDRFTETWRAWHADTNQPVPLLCTYAGLDLLFIASYLGLFVIAAHRVQDLPPAWRHSFHGLLVADAVAEAVEMGIQLFMGRTAEPPQWLGHVLGWATFAKLTAIVLAAVMLAVTAFVKRRCG